MSKSNDKKLWVGRLHRIDVENCMSIKTVVSDKFDVVDSLVAHLAKNGTKLSDSEKKTINGFIEDPYIWGISVAVGNEFLCLSFWRVE